MENFLLSEFVPNYLEMSRSLRNLFHGTFTTYTRWLPKVILYHICFGTHAFSKCECKGVCLSARLLTYIEILSKQNGDKEIGMWYLTIRDQKHKLAAFNMKLKSNRYWIPNISDNISYMLRCSTSSCDSWNTYTINHVIQLLCFNATEDIVKNGKLSNVTWKRKKVMSVLQLIR